MNEINKGNVGGVVGRGPISEVNLEPDGEEYKNEVGYLLMKNK